MPFPPTFDHAWDITQPPDTQLANLLGQDIRNLKDDVMQRMSLLSGTLANRPTPETINATWGGVGFGLIYFATDVSQLFQWSGSAWVAIGFTAVVALVNLTAQAAAITPTTLYAVPSNGAGIYRGSIHLVLVTQGTGGFIKPQFLWSNEHGNDPGGRGFGTGIQPTLGVGSEGDILQNSYNDQTTGQYMRVAASTNIQYQVQFSGVTGTPTYDVFVRLEYLG